MDRTRRTRITTLALVGLLSILWAPSGARAGGPADAGPPPAAPAAVRSGALLVRFRAGTPSARAAVHAALRARVLRRFALVPGLELVALPEGMGLAEALAAYHRAPEVLYAEPDVQVRVQAFPNDPRFGDLWGLHNTGQQRGTPDADIDAPEAWDLSTGDQTVIIAILDTGLDYTHEDLAANAWQNPRDCDGNGIDDDGNGYADDCRGVDMVNEAFYNLGDSDPMDDHGHGTHVAGTIGAVANNGLGVVGIAWQVRLLPCKFLDQTGSGWTSDAILCLEYVKALKDRGEPILATSNSWGSHEFSQALFDAIDAHRASGLLFIAAAGNNTWDNDQVVWPGPVYPAGYHLPNILAVAATIRTDRLAWFSNFGRRTVHLGAPGAEIWSTVPRGSCELCDPSGYLALSGTSMATPHVAGVAALLKAQDPTRDWVAIKNLLLTGGDPQADLAGTTITGQRLNARGALTCANRSLLAFWGAWDPTTLVGSPLALNALHLRCEEALGPVGVVVSPTGETVSLFDDGRAPDQEAGDGVVSGVWTPTALGPTTLTLPNGDALATQVLAPYAVTQSPMAWRTITGTSLDLDNGEMAELALPFPIPFGGGSFSKLWVGDDGFLTFTPLARENDIFLGLAQLYTYAAAWEDDLVPFPGTNRNVFWAVLGTAPTRELVIEWRNVSHRNCIILGEPEAAITFQVVLFEGRSEILFHYRDTVFGGRCGPHAGDNGTRTLVSIQVALAEDGETVFCEPIFSMPTPCLFDGMGLSWTSADVPVSWHTLTVTVSGSGTVTSNPAGISCPPTCSASFADGASVTLTAAPAPGWSFQAWTGACAGPGNPCTLTMDADHTVTAAFRPEDTPPLADAGPDQTVDEGATVTLDGTGSSDPDGDPLTFRWTQTAGPAVSLSGATTATPSFRTPFVGSTTLLTFELTVSDGSLSSTDTVVVTVQDLGASLRGTVTGSGPVAGAQVTLKKGRKTVGTTVTGPDGFYAFRGLGPARYTVTVKASGFRSQYKKVTLAAGEDKVLDVTLKPRRRR